MPNTVTDVLNDTALTPTWVVQDDTDIVDINGNFIATIHNPNSDVGTLQEYQRAHLIAAAPNMLKALKIIIEMWDESEKTSQLGWLMSVVAESAITESRGV